MYRIRQTVSIITGKTCTGRALRSTQKALAWLKSKAKAFIEVMRELLGSKVADEFGAKLARAFA
jgi:hypothetical protein